MPMRVIKKPFHKPHKAAIPRATIYTTGKGVLVTPVWVPIRESATAAVMAITGPTERSTPPVAITSVMPSASTMGGAPFHKISIILPYRWPFLISRLKKFGLKIRLKTASPTRAKTDQVNPLLLFLFQNCLIRFIFGLRASDAGSIGETDKA